MASDFPVLMGVDLGTSSAKAVIVDLEGRLLALAQQEYALETPHPGWAEQDPETWYRAAAATMEQALRQSGVCPDSVAAIGLAGQMHGLACFDREGRALRPAIIWADQRSGEQVAEVYRLLGRERLAAWTGNPLAAGFMLASWLWLRQHEPEVCRRTRWMLLPKDALRLWLVGEVGSEPSDASSTLLFDLAGRCWSAPLLEALGIDPDLLPPISPSSGVAGGLRPEAAALTGLVPGTPVVFGGSDQALQALGQGVVTPGLVSCTIGTGGQLFAVTLQPRPDPDLRLHLFCHALPETWHLEAAILSAGLSLRWLRDQVMPGQDYAALADAAVGVSPGAEGLFFLPYLVGERTPLMDPGARGAFIGLTLRHDWRAMVRAVMEGVVLALRQGLELMGELGVECNSILAGGGATRHPLWLQLQADIFNLPVIPSQMQESTARGASLLAGVGAGLYADAREAARRTVHLAEDAAVLPRPAFVDFYAGAYRTYRRLAELSPNWRSTPDQSR
jgi:xylulokinase